MMPSIFNEAFEGRVGRQEYWWSMLALVLAGFVAAAFALIGAGSVSVTFVMSLIYGVVFGAAYLLALGLFIRRLHDIGLQGWVGVALFLALFTVFIVGSYPDASGTGALESSIGTVFLLAVIGAGLMPGARAANAYGSALTYRSWWAALIGSKGGARAAA